MPFPVDQVNIPKKYAHLTPKQYVEALIDSMEKYRDLISLHVVDFMTKDLWSVIPKEWQLALLPDDDSVHTQEWIDSIINITSGNGIKEEWPESLKLFIKDTEDIILPRQNEQGDDQIKITIDKRILSGMMEKKIHEVERMTPVIKTMANEHDIASVVDLGAGQGYLSRSIAYKSNIKVLAIDSSEIQTCGAKKFDEKALKKDKDALKLIHVTDFITQENASTILSKWSDHPQQEKWLLCGLHTCGDLASHMLRLFTTSSEMTCFVDVGCCYHFLTESVTEQAGFPVSQFVRSKKMQLGPRATMLACQAPARWLDQPEETLMAYEHHFFRCLLQFIMVEKGLTDVSKAPVLGRLNKKTAFTSFPVYVKTALKKLKLPEDSITPEEAENYYNEHKGKNVDKQIIILWTLRVLLGPVIESLILMDRWVYLDESIPESPTKRVWMWPLFDLVKSPRNMVITATK